jgi:hypothetical protein
MTENIGGVFFRDLRMAPELGGVYLPNREGLDLHARGDCRNAQLALRICEPRQCLKWFLGSMPSRRQTERN